MFELLFKLSTWSTYIYLQHKDRNEDQSGLEAISLDSARFETLPRPNADWETCRRFREHDEIHSREAAHCTPCMRHQWSPPEKQVKTTQEKVYDLRPLSKIKEKVTHRPFEQRFWKQSNIWKIPIIPILKFNYWSIKVTSGHLLLQLSTISYFPAHIKPAEQSIGRRTKRRKKA